MRKALTGSVVGVAASVAVAFALLPARSHLSIATAALVLVVPVVAGVATGGFVAGLASVVAGFLVYDWTFIPPYRTLTVGSGQDWVALGVYAVVMAVVARVVSAMDRARHASAAREAGARHLVELSELLLAERSVPELGRAVVGPLCERLGVDGAALLVAAGERLDVVAAAGEPFAAGELDRLGSRPVHLAAGSAGRDLYAVALSTPTRPVGVLALRGMPPEPALREILPVLANHLALALERSQLRERATQAEILEAVDRLRAALLGAVSHDLRTPLATIKIAGSALAAQGEGLAPHDAAELCRLIEAETDRLSSLVGGLLDMTRLQAGVLGVERESLSVADLLAWALAARDSSFGEGRVVLDVAGSLPAVCADRVLIGQVLANLLDNADRFAPEGTAITVSAAAVGDHVEISVADRGPGVPADERDAVFDSFVRFDTGGRAGLGLWIAKTFVEAHGQRIWVADAAGACFVFTLEAVRHPAPAGRGA